MEFPPRSGIWKLNWYIYFGKTVRRTLAKMEVIWMKYETAHSFSALVVACRPTCRTCLGDKPWQRPLSYGGFTPDGSCDELWPPDKTSQWIAAGSKMPANGFCLIYVTYISHGLFRKTVFSPRKEKKNWACCKASAFSIITISPWRLLNTYLRQRAYCIQFRSLW